MANENRRRRQGPARFAIVVIVLTDATPDQRPCRGCASRQPLRRGRGRHGHDLSHDPGGRGDALCHCKVLLNPTQQHGNWTAANPDHAQSSLSRVAAGLRDQRLAAEQDGRLRRSCSVLRQSGLAGIDDATAREAWIGISVLMASGDQTAFSRKRPLRRARTLIVPRKESMMASVRRESMHWSVGAASWIRRASAELLAKDGLMSSSLILWPVRTCCDRGFDRRDLWTCSSWGSM